MQELQRLNAIDKILMATATVNFLANRINQLRMELRPMPHPRHQELAREQEELLSDAVGKLSEVMNKLGDYLNAKDGSAAIDGLITYPAFMVIDFGKDHYDRTSWENTDYDTAPQN